MRQDNVTVKLASLESASRLSGVAAAETEIHAEANGADISLLGPDRIYLGAPGHDDRPASLVKLASDTSSPIVTGLVEDSCAALIAINTPDKSLRAVLHVKPPKSYELDTESDKTLFNIKLNKELGIVFEHLDKWMRNNPQASSSEPDINIDLVITGGTKKSSFGYIKDACIATRELIEAYVDDKVKALKNSQRIKYKKDINNFGADDNAHASWLHYDPTTNVASILLRDKDPSEARADSYVKQTKALPVKGHVETLDPNEDVINEVLRREYNDENNVRVSGTFGFEEPEDDSQALLFDFTKGGAYPDGYQGVRKVFVQSQDIYRGLGVKYVIVGRNNCIADGDLKLRKIDNLFDKISDLMSFEDGLLKTLDQHAEIHIVRSAAYPYLHYSSDANKYTYENGKFVPVPIKQPRRQDVEEFMEIVTDKDRPKEDLEKFFNNHGFVQNLVTHAIASSKSPDSKIDLGNNSSQVLAETAKILSKTVENLYPGFKTNTEDSDKYEDYGRFAIRDIDISSVTGALKQAMDGGLAALRPHFKAEDMTKIKDFLQGRIAQSDLNLEESASEIPIDGEPYPWEDVFEQGSREAVEKHLLGIYPLLFSKNQPLDHSLLCQEEFFRTFTYFTNVSVKGLRATYMGTDLDKVGSEQTDVLDMTTDDAKGAYKFTDTYPNETSAGNLYENLSSKLNYDLNISAGLYRLMKKMILQTPIDLDAANPKVVEFMRNHLANTFGFLFAVATNANDVNNFIRNIGQLVDPETNETFRSLAVSSN